MSTTEPLGTLQEREIEVAVALSPLTLGIPGPTRIIIVILIPHIIAILILHICSTEVYTTILVFIVNMISCTSQQPYIPSACTNVYCE